MKKLGLVTVALSALLLNACGGSSESTTDKLKKRNAIEIYHNATTGSCIMDNIVPNTIINPEIHEYANTVSCATFNRGAHSTAYGEYCREFDAQEGGNIACVLGFDDFTGYKAAKVSGEEANEIISDGIVFQ